LHERSTLSTCTRTNKKRRKRAKIENQGKRRRVRMDELTGVPEDDDEERTGSREKGMIPMKGCRQEGEEYRTREHEARIHKSVGEKKRSGIRHRQGDIA
jgi:hypothetical protein